MPNKLAPRLFLVSFGIALLLAGLFFDSRAALSQSAVTPTPDRLAQPTLPVQPSQADVGAQVYWLSCLPCHGDKGQGLTEEFIQTYPREEQNCWVSGCHGARPYEEGFTIPRSIPAVIGSGALQKFPNAVVLQAYIKGAMPYWRPGMLSDEENWQVAAFLLRENRLWDGSVELNAQNAASVWIQPPAPTKPAAPPQPAARISPAWVIFPLLALILLLAWRHYNRP